MSLALNVVRLLRRLPHTARFDRHLDDCAALEVFYRPLAPEFPPLKVSQALGLVPLPSFNPPVSKPSVERVPLTVVADNTSRRLAKQEPLDAA